MRKIPKCYENFIDDILINVGDKCMTTYKSLSMTPNDITTLSVIMCIISAIFIFRKQFIYGAIFFYLGYFFDCCDGHYARKYNLVSKFGDMYDHYGDLFKFLLIMFALYKVNSKTFLKVIPFILILLLLSGVHLGCQEIFYEKNESDTLNFTKNMCNAIGNTNILNKLNITKYFGTGTLMTFVALVILFYGEIF